MRYEGNIFRPFSEANSYLLQCTIGCSHNACTFCGMYKDKKYRIRPVSDILEDIDMAKEQNGDCEKVFLMDGDAIAMPMEDLLTILNKLYSTFKSIRHVGTYVGPQSTLEKGIDNLKILRKNGLTKAYLGVESGLDEALLTMRKGVNADEMLRSGLVLKEADINLSAMVLLGIMGSGPKSKEHGIATAEMMNKMKPQYLAALTTTAVPGTKLFRDIENGSFNTLSPRETLEEMRYMIDGITSDNIKFVGAHASNYLPISGTLQKDKSSMINIIDQALGDSTGSYLREENQRGL